MLGQRRSPGDRHAGAGLALLLIRAVQVFHLRELFARFDSRFDLLIQLSLLIDEPQHIRLALFQLLLRMNHLLDLADGLFIQPLCPLFAIAGDEGHRAAFLQQRHHCLHLGTLHLQPACHRFHQFHVHLSSDSKTHYT